MIKNQDIIITGLQAWDVEIGSNCKSIALEFSKNNRVLYVNSPLDRKTYLFDRKDSKNHYPRAPRPPFIDDQKVKRLLLQAFYMLEARVSERQFGHTTAAH